MLDFAGRKTDQAHWDSAWSMPIRARLPSRLNVSVRNFTRLLARHVQPGDRYLEIGCAPGKMLAWVASVLKAEVAGIDYSQPGIEQCRMLFRSLGLKGDLVLADFFEHGLPPASFDVVASFGVIEHFDDAGTVVQRHLDLVKPGGLALITVPHYGGVYGTLQRWCDPASMERHNTAIMTPRALSALVNPQGIESVRAYPCGSMSPWLLDLDRRLPRIAATTASLLVNAVGLLQPATIHAVAPLLVLEVRKGPVR
jgi:2-polyprenyl-3-methyl-5-hydroxy-6-metoxy-1,4-benzoquinol methylase